MPMALATSRDGITMGTASTEKRLDVTSRWSIRVIRF